MNSKFNFKANDRKWYQVEFYGQSDEIDIYDDMSVWDELGLQVVDEDILEQAKYRIMYFLEEAV